MADENEVKALIARFWDVRQKLTADELLPLPHQFTRDARHLAHEARERILTAEIERLRAGCCDPKPKGEVT